MASKDELTPFEKEELRKNETVDFLLSRLSAGERIVKKATLSLHIRRWLTTVKQHGEVPSRVPEFLFHVLIHFVTPEKAEDIREIQPPERFTASGQWLIKVWALINEHADERLLRHLESLPDGRVIYCHELKPSQERFENLPVDSQQFGQSDGGSGGYATFPLNMESPRPDEHTRLLQKILTGIEDIEKKVTEVLGEHHVGFTDVDAQRGI